SAGTADQRLQRVRGAASVRRLSGHPVSTKTVYRAADCGGSGNPARFVGKSPVCPGTFEPSRTTVGRSPLDRAGRPRPASLRGGSPGQGRRAAGEGARPMQSGWQFLREDTTLAPVPLAGDADV